MGLLRVVMALTMALAAGAQTEDIHQRVLRAVGPEAAQKAAALLAEKRFAEVETMLAVAPAGTKQMQSEVAALRGVLEFLGGRMEGAARYFQEAGLIGTLRESDRFTNAMALIKLGRDEQARGELTELAAHDPDKALYTYWLGRLDYDQRRYTEAVEHLRRATQLDASGARPWDSLGLALDMQGNGEEALRALEEGARLNREQAHPSAWPPNDLGSLLLRRGEIQRSEAALREALRYDPSLPEAHYRLGRALEKEDANDDALNEYLAAMKLDSKETDACYSLAMLYRKMHRKREAEAAFTEWRRRRDGQQ